MRDHGGSFLVPPFRPRLARRTPQFLEQFLDVLLLRADGLQLGLLLSGAVLTETIYALPGLGRLMVDSILSRDYPVVQAAALFTALLFVLVNLAVDLAYGLLDPRIRLR